MSSGRLKNKGAGTVITTSPRPVLKAPQAPQRARPLESKNTRHQDEDHKRSRVGDY